MPLGSACLGLSSVEFLEESPAVAGRTSGSVAIPFTCTPFTWPLVAVGATPLVAALVAPTLPLLTMLPFIDMLSQLSPASPCVEPTPLNRVPGPPISLDLRGGRCWVSEICGRYVSPEIGQEVRRK